MTVRVNRTETRPMENSSYFVLPRYDIVFVLEPDKGTKQAQRAKSKPIRPQVGLKLKG